jgi:hypothetical protein
MSNSIENPMESSNQDNLDNPDNLDNQENLNEAHANELDNDNFNQVIDVDDVDNNDVDNNDNEDEDEDEYEDEEEEEEEEVDSISEEVDSISADIDDDYSISMPHRNGYSSIPVDFPVLTGGVRDMVSPQSARYQIGALKKKTNTINYNTHKYKMIPFGTKMQLLKKKLGVKKDANMGTAIRSLIQKNASIRSNLSKIQKPYRSILQVRMNVLINNFNNNGWLIPSDFDANMVLSDDDLMIRSVTVQSLMDIIPTIIPQNSISSEDLDDNFKTYLQNAPNGINYLIEMMFTNSAWTFEPIKKVLWIYLMMACYYEPRALKYLIKNASFDKELLNLKNGFGMSCILVASKNDDISTFMELHKYGLIEEADLHLQHINGVTPLMLIFSNRNLFFELIENEEFDFVHKNIKCDLGNELTPFIVACGEQPDIAKYMITNKIVTKNDFAKKYRGFTPLMMLALYNSDILLDVINSEFVDIDIIKIKHTVNGNVFTMIAKETPQLVIPLLESGKINKEIVEQRLGYGIGQSINVMFLLAEFPQIFMKLLESEYIDKEFISNCRFENESLISFIMNFNFDTAFIKSVFDSDKFTPEMITNSGCLFKAVESMQMDIVDLITKSKSFSSETLLYQNKDNCNVVMMLLVKNQESVVGSMNDDIIVNDDVVKADIVQGCIDGNTESNAFNSMIPFITTELLKQRDVNGLSTFAYFMMFMSDTLFKMIDDKLIESTTVKECLKEEYNADGTNMLCAILCMLSHRSESGMVQKVLDMNEVTSELLESTYGELKNTILFELLEFNNDAFTKLLTHDKCTEVLLKSKNIDGRNILNYISTLLCSKSNNVNIVNWSMFFKLIANSKYSDDEFFNSKDYKGFTNLMSIVSIPIRFKSSLTKKMISGIIDIILSHKLFDQKTFAAKNDIGKTCFDYACEYSTEDNIKKLCENPLFEEKMYTFVTIIYILKRKDLSKDYLIRSKYNTPNKFKKGVKNWMTNFRMTEGSLDKILSCEHLSNDILMFTNKNGISMLGYSMVESYELAEKIVTSKFCSKELFQLRDNNGRNIMYYVAGHPDLTKLIVNNPYFDESMLLLVNSIGYSPLHKMLVDGLVDNVEYILESGKCGIASLLHESKDGTSVINEMSNYKLEKIILKLPFIKTEHLMKVNEKGQTCLHTSSLFIDPDEVYRGIKNILYSEKCTSELMEMKDKNGDTFLTLNYELLYDLLHLSKCTKKLLYSANNNGLTVLSLLCGYKPDLIPMLLNDYRVGSDILIAKENVLSPFSVSVTLSNSAIDRLLDSPHCTSKIVNTPCEHELTALTIAYFKGHVDNINKLLDSKYDLTESFTDRDSNGRTLLMHAACSSLSMFEILFNSSYMNIDRIMDGDNYNHNVVIHALNSNLPITKRLLESQYWTNEVQTFRDIDNDFLLLYPYKRPDIVKYLYESGKCTEEMVNMTNRVKMNCSHYYSLHSPESLKYLLNSDICTEHALTQKDYLGNTCIHTAFEKNIESGMTILDSTRFKREYLEITNKKGITPLMLALKHNKNIAKKLSEMGLINYDNIKINDRNGDNVLHYAIKYCLTVARTIITSDYFEKLIGEINYDNETPAIIACRHNGRLIKDILNSGYCENNMLSHQHTDYGSCLTLAAEYQPIAVKHLLGWDKLGEMIIRTYDNHRDFVEIACQYNPKAVKYIIESDRDLSKFFEGKNVIIAAKYHPESLDMILKSKYGSSKLFDIYNRMENCTDIAFRFQPKSLVIIIDSEHSTPEIINREDMTTGYRLLSKLQGIYNFDILEGDITLNTVDDIKNLNLINTNNIACNDDMDSVCEICYEFEAIIHFDCNHKCCVGCAFKAESCHICRNVIADRIIINNE